MSQPVPNYTEDDLARIIARDYAIAADRVRAIIAQYGKETSPTDQLRVRMACLKLARGNTKELEQYVQAACEDYRDVLAWAEYPAYMKAWTPDTRQKAVESDWKQLQEWLHAKQK